MTKRKVDSILQDVEASNQNDEDFDIKVLLERFWPSQMDRITKLTPDYFRAQMSSPELPLARIKKVMRLDDNIKNQMISGEVPALFAKAIEIFIEELTLRAWYFTEESKRKIMQKTDINIAVANYDQFDFLIDIVPREDIPQKPPTHKKPNNSFTKTNDGSLKSLTSNSIGTSVSSKPPKNSMPANSVVAQCLFGQQNVEVAQSNSNGAKSLQNVSATPTTTSSNNGAVTTSTTTIDTAALFQSLVEKATQKPKLVATAGQQDQAPQVYQQIVNSDGSVQHVPVQLQISPAQLQMLKSQLSSVSPPRAGNSNFGQSKEAAASSAPSFSTPALLVRQANQMPGSSLSSMKGNVINVRIRDNEKHN